MCSWRNRCDTTLFNKEECSTIIEYLYTGYIFYKSALFSMCIYSANKYKHTQGSLYTGDHIQVMYCYWISFGYVTG